MPVRPALSGRDQKPSRSTSGQQEDRWIQGPAA